MKAIEINGKEYKLEFTFEAAEHKQLVQKMFNIASGAFVAKHTANVKSDDDGLALIALIEGTSEMISEIPHIAKIAFYAGLLENNPVSEEESLTLLKTYMKENKLSYNMVYEMLKECMEDDGFFDLSGIREMLEKMTQKNEEITDESKKEKIAKIPQDHKKKQTGTK